MSYPIALAFYPPSHSKQGNSGGRPSINGIRELAASSRNSRYVTIPLVVSYTTFSPLRINVKTMTRGSFLLSTPIVTNSSYIREWSILAARTFLSSQRTSDRPGYCFISSYSFSSTVALEYGVYRLL